MSSIKVRIEGHVDHVQIGGPFSTKWVGMFIKDERQNSPNPILTVSKVEMEFGHCELGGIRLTRCFDAVGVVATDAKAIRHATLLYLGFQMRNNRHPVYVYVAESSETGTTELRLLPEGSDGFGVEIWNLPADAAEEPQGVRLPLQLLSLADLGQLLRLLTGESLIPH